MYSSCMMCRLFMFVKYKNEHCWVLSAVNLSVSFNHRDFHYNTSVIHAGAYYTLLQYCTVVFADSNRTYW